MRKGRRARGGYGMPAVAGHDREAVETSGRQRGLGLLDDGLKCRRLADRQVRQDLAVDEDARLGEPVNEPAVSQAERPHRGIEPLDPERAKRALLALTAAVSVLRGLFDRLLGDPDGVLAAAIISLGSLQNLLVLGMRGDATFDAGHG